MTSTSANLSPYLQANAWSRFFHSWVYQLFTKSRKEGTLHVNDLYDLPAHLKSSPLSDQLEVNWLHEIEQNPEKPSLIRATVRTIGWKLFALGFLLIPMELSKIVQPLLLIYLMEFFEPCSAMPVWFACLLVTAITINAVFSNIFHHLYFYSMQILGLKMHIAYTGLIYRKVLRLSSGWRNTISSGRLINLLSNDAGQIEVALGFLHYIWVAPLELIFVIVFLWHFVKYIALIAVGYTLLLLFSQTIFAHILVQFRIKIMKVTDERLKIMSEVVRSMRIVKMYCWESLFENKISRVRRREIIRYGFRSILNCFQKFLSHTYIPFTFLMIYTTTWLLNIRLETRFFAIAACMIGYMRLYIINYFYYAVRDLSHYISARKRIEELLVHTEFDRDRRLLSTSMHKIKQEDDAKQRSTSTESINVAKPSAGTSPYIMCNLHRARWEENGLFELKNILFDARPGDLICVVGPVGAGKTSLLEVLMGEIKYFDGIVRSNGSVCYVSQESWIFSSTIENNILFGKDYNDHLFHRVVRATALDLDFIQLSHGCKTFVGDQGVTLSGGQKTRINLARALYRDADIYFLDDPLSAVDVRVSRHIFENSIKGFLRQKICVLVTHQIQFLREATMVILLNNGEAVQTGPFEELLATSQFFAQLLNNIDQHVQESQYQEQSSDPHKQQSTYSEKNDEKDILSPLISIEKKQEGTVNIHVYAAYLKAGLGLILGSLLLVSLFAVHQVTAIISNWWLAMWSDDESRRHRIFHNCTDIVAQGSKRIRDMSDTEWNAHRNYRFYSYCVMVLVLFLITLLRSGVTDFICLNAGRVLHNKVFQRLIRCPIYFFDLNPVGRILSRFSKDVSIMDDTLPQALFDFLDCSFQVLSTLIFVGYLNPWSFILGALCIIGMLFLRSRFVQCSRDLKRLEGTTRSPVHSYLSSTIQGLEVIRSYRAEKMCSKEFLDHLDDNTRAKYLIQITTRWAAIRFDWISLGFITLTTLLAVMARVAQYKLSSADIALILVYSLNLIGYLQWTIRQSVECETQMTAVERILEYCSLEQEPFTQMSSGQHPRMIWPLNGQITFENVSIRHAPCEESSLALNHISFTIEAAEKVGIVGRTGAGKSSLIQTLFRMVSMAGGRITIDGIDIATVGLEEVRRSISIIPQEPVLFTGSLRNNLDEFGNYSDAEVWLALEQVQLKLFVNEIMPNGLQSIISEGGSNLSVGQKQLICLARAFLKKRKILIIDEATANVDNATDELIQRAIRDKFKQCTVVTVAHRLRTVIDSDRILVLGNGEVLEFDSPRVLLDDPNSHLASLVKQTGLAEAEYLRRVADSAGSYRN